MFRQIGPTEILIVLGVVLLLFGGKKLPELARGSGRALRIFKSEVKDLHDDDDDEHQACVARERQASRRTRSPNRADAWRFAAAQPPPRAARCRSSSICVSCDDASSSPSLRSWSAPSSAGSSIDPIFDFLKQPYVDGIAPLLDRQGVRRHDRHQRRSRYGVQLPAQARARDRPGHLGEPGVDQPDLAVRAPRAAPQREAVGLPADRDVGVPLFAAGISVGYVVLPKGIEVLIGFAPELGRRALTSLGDYLNFVHPHRCWSSASLREIPLVVVMLNRLGIVSGRQLARGPSVDRDRHLRLRCGRNPEHRPADDAVPRGPDDRALPAVRGHRQAHGPPQGQAPSADELRR